MFRMKTTCLWAMACAALFTSCMKSIDLSVEGYKPETYSEVRFTIGGECSTTEVPLTRSSNLEIGRAHV